MANVPRVAHGQQKHKPKTRIKWALERVTAEIRSETNQGSLFSRGLSIEGYSGGYADALRDVLLLMNGVVPERRNYWALWDEE